MGTINASEIVGRAATILQDVTNVRWDQTELINSLNDGQREIALLSPESCTTTSTLTLVAGTRQSLPANGTRLIAVVRNMVGGVPGRAIRLVSRSVLDAQKPNWHSEAANSTIMHYTFDQRNPKSFYVYPPSSGGAVEVVYSSVPTTVTVGQAISIDDIYANALLDFVLYRSYLKDAEYTQNSERAMLHYKAFVSSISAKDPVDATVEPASMTSSSRPMTATNG